MRKVLFMLTAAICLTTVKAQITQGKVFDAIVAADGSGDYSTLQAAIDAAPSMCTRPYLIFIKNGRYEELINIANNKTQIHLIGQDPHKTIICYTLHSGGPKDVEFQYSVNNPEYSAYKCHATAEIAGADFYAEGITFENTYGVERQNGPQALALRTLADRQALFNCRLRSFQDTWFTSSDDHHRQYVKNCWIEGAVDYMYGGADVLVEQSTFYNVRSGSVITAPCHNQDAKYGYVMRDCVVDGNEKAVSGKQLLGRPWHNAPISIWINTTMRIPIAPEGWTNMGAIPKLFVEYGSQDAQGQPIDLTNRKTQYEYTMRQTGDKVSGHRPAIITQQEADSIYTYENMINAQDGWNPRLLMIQLPSPPKIRTSRNRLNWEPVNEAIGYIVTDATDQVIAITKECKCLITDRHKHYTVRAVSSSGSLGK